MSNNILSMFVNTLYCHIFLQKNIIFIKNYEYFQYIRVLIYFAGHAGFGSDLNFTQKIVWHGAKNVWKVSKFPSSQFSKFQHSPNPKFLSSQGPKLSSSQAPKLPSTQAPKLPSSPAPKLPSS